MWTYSKDDELKNKLKYDLIFWYQHWYMGNDNALKHHLELLEEHYSPELFDNEKTRKEDIIKFMEFLQGELDKKGIE